MRRRLSLGLRGQSPGVSARGLHDADLEHLSTLYSSAVGERQPDSAIKAQLSVDGHAALQAAGAGATNVETARPRNPSPPSRRSPEARTLTPLHPIPFLPPPKLPPPPPLAECFFCCSPAVESAFFKIFVCNLTPLGNLVQSAMHNSAKEVAYFITDTTAVRCRVCVLA
jgi:hypothetical protein